MWHLAWVCSGLLAVTPPPADGLPAEELAQYQAAKANAGRDPALHIKLALWCESHGMNAERLKHLALAVLSDPRNATARGLMGLVADGGRWKRPEAVAEKRDADAALAATLGEYNALRSGLEDEAAPELKALRDAQERGDKAAAERSRSALDRRLAPAHEKLGLWCEEHGLAAEAVAHFTAATTLDPNRATSWEHLGCRKYNGRWMSAAQVAAEQAEAVAQGEADRKWAPLLSKWKGWLTDKSRRAKAEAALAEVTDPRAVPSVWKVFAQHGVGSQPLAVQLLGQIDSIDASRALAKLAVFSASSTVRRRAIETLRRRDSREFLGPLIAVLRRTFKYEVRPVGGPGSPGVLFVEGERFNVRRLYTSAPPPDVALMPGDIVTFDALGLPVITRSRNPNQNAAPVIYGPGFQVLRAPGSGTREIPIGRMYAQYQQSALVAQQQLQNDIRSIDGYNAEAKAANEMTVAALTGITGKDLADDREAWLTWWTDQRGYVYEPPAYGPKPTFSQVVPSSYTPSYVHTACFAAGTLVRTLSGPKPIESLRVGDQVLSQDVKTGSLAFQPVTTMHYNPPSPTLRISFGGEPIVATGIHRFWKAGKGWVMARDLKAGDQVRSVGGVVRVASIEPDRIRPVFNLDVAETQTFFVGEADALVHDNGLVEAVPEPFDAEPSLASIARPHD
jgi:hypothetical protein